jgi:hypothetical protein
MSPNPIPLFDCSCDHPSVPTWRTPEHCAQTRSRMPLAAPAQPARSVLDGVEHSAMLPSQGRHHRCLRGYRPAKNPCSLVGSPPSGRVAGRRADISSTPRGKREDRLIDKFCQDLGGGLRL